MELSEVRYNDGVLRPRYEIEVTTKHGVLMLRYGTGYNFNLAWLEGVLTLFGVEYHVDTFLDLDQRAVDVSNGQPRINMWRRRYLKYSDSAPSGAAHKALVALLDELLARPELDELQKRGTVLYYEGEIKATEDRRIELQEQINVLDAQLSKLHFKLAKAKGK